MQSFEESSSITDELDEDEEEEEEVVVIEITQTMTEVEPLSLTNRSPKRYIGAALGGGFEVKAGTTETIERRQPYKSGDRAGEARPDLEKKHLWVDGRADGAQFKLHFVDNGFKEAWVWDSVGWPVELYVDYTPTKTQLKQRKQEPERPWKKRVEDTKAEAERRDREYNDRTFFTNTAMRVVTAAWQLDEWLADLVPGFVPAKSPAQKKAEKAEKEEREAAAAADLITIGEWNG